MKLKKYSILLALVLAVGCVAGCGDKKAEEPTTQATISIIEETTVAPTTEAPTVAEEQPVLSKEGMERSPITGEWVKPEIASRRPLCIMINNIEDAIPQSGISRADILYEAYVESSITRLMMVTQRYDDMEKIGPVRSCREFYVYFAKEYDGIYTHFGFSPLAKNLLESPNVQHIDGMYYDNGTNFYRTTDRKAPHNAYTSTKGLLDAINKKGWSLTLASGYEMPMTFTEYDVKQIEIENGLDCTLFKPGFSRNKPEFRYDANDGLYYRYQYGDKHVDVETGEQLAFKNILVKFVTGTKFENGTPILDLMGSGPAYYITNGKLVQVEWKKDTEFGPTKYYFNDGEEVIFNQGKTFVNIVTMADLKDLSYE